MKHNLFVGLVMVGLFGSLGCEPSSSTETKPVALDAKAMAVKNNSPIKPGEAITIAVIPKGTTHEFWKSVHAGAVKAERELKAGGANVRIIWKGPLKEDDRSAQIGVVESFTSGSGKVTGMVLAPLDATALARPVRDGLSRGVPTVVFDSALAGKAGRDFVSFVATDNYHGGFLAGKHLAKLLGGKGKVVMLRYQEGSASTENREQGFLDAIKEHAGIEVISENQRGGATTDSALKASENLMPTLEKADGVFCPNESTTSGMLRALEMKQKVGKLKFVGFDASPDLVEALKEGKIDALTVQNPMHMGYMGVKTMHAYLVGEEVPTRVDTGVALVTKQALDDPKIKDVIDPPLDEYLD